MFCKHWTMMCITFRFVAYAKGHLRYLLSPYHDGLPCVIMMLVLCFFVFPCLIICIFPLAAHNSLFRGWQWKFADPVVLNFKVNVLSDFNYLIPFSKGI